MKGDILVTSKQFNHLFLSFQGTMFGDLKDIVIDCESSPTKAETNLFISKYNSHHKIYKFCMKRSSMTNVETKHEKSFYRQKDWNTLQLHRQCCI